VACELFGPARGLYVGRVSSGHGPVDFGPVAAQLVPGTVGVAIGGTALGINAHGVAVLAWDFSGPYAAWLEKPSKIAAVMWRLGHRLGSPSMLSAPPGAHNGGVDGVAVNSLGTAVVVFHDQRGLEAAQLQHERVRGTQTLSETAEATSDLEVFATRSLGFRASWRLSSPAGLERPSARQQTTVYRARAGSEGRFSVDPPSAIRLLITPKLESPFDSAWGVELHSNIRGDQLLTWGASGPTGRRVYAVSRRAGAVWGATQVVGTPPAPSSVQSVIAPRGRFTVLWIGALGVEATAGAAGGVVSAPHPLAREEIEKLTVLPDGTTIAMWSHRPNPLALAGAMEAATSRDGLHFTRPRVISRKAESGCGDPRLLIASEHSAIAEWRCSRSSEASRYRS
jgi:hypothetical protein